MTCETIQFITSIIEAFITLVLFLITELLPFISDIPHNGILHGIYLILTGNTATQRTRDISNSLTSELTNSSTETIPLTPKGRRQCNVDK